MIALLAVLVRLNFNWILGKKQKKDTKLMNSKKHIVKNAPIQIETETNRDTSSRKGNFSAEGIGLFHTETEYQKTWDNASQAESNLNTKRVASNLRF